MEYHIFDIIKPGLQGQRSIDLMEIFTKGYGQLRFGPIVCVQTEVAYDFQAIMLVYESYLARGYEGMIIRAWDAPYIRRRSTQVMKFKPKKYDDYLVIGYEEEISIEGEPKGTLGALVCTSDDGSKFNVGSGFTAEDRRNLWERREQLIGRTVQIKYQHITHTGGVPRFPVFKAEVLK
jgi:DNA ligase-1